MRNLSSAKRVADRTLPTRPEPSSQEPLRPTVKVEIEPSSEAPPMPTVIADVVEPSINAEDVPVSRSDHPETESGV